VFVFLHGAPRRRPGRDGARVHGHGVVDEQLDPDGRAARGYRPARPVRQRLGGEEERRAVDRQPRYDVAAGVEVPEHRRPERRAVERDRRVPIADG
jgi:hypothetical protein